jgi:dipeptide/tripeptide permease
MLIAVGIFVAGKTLYKHIATEGNALMDIYRVYSTALRCKRNSIDKSMSLLEYAKQEIATEQVENVQKVVQVLTLLLPTPVFWALYDQQSSHWTFQAMQMNNKIGSFSIKPEQMQIVNAFLILACIPLFDRVIYPSAKRLGFKCSSVQKIACGMIFASASFVLAAILQSTVQQGIFLTNPTTGLLECTEKCTNILWQIPQYVLITFGEIMFSITGLEFAYSQAPGNMKSFCQSFWLMTVAVGNLLVIAISFCNVFSEPQPGISSNSQIAMYLTYASIQWMAVVWFLWLSRGFAFTRESVMIVDEQE